MIANFTACWAFTAQREGGYTSNPADAGNWTGGKCGVGTCAGTNYGISAAAYPNIDIKTLTQSHAGIIMKTDYWDKVAGDDLPAGVDCVVLDSAVNQGSGFAARTLQAVVGAVQDGDIGPETLKAIRAKGIMETIEAFTAARVDAYKADEGFPIFGKAWINRAVACGMTALGMVPPLP